jgi:Cu/Ag efflux pump CusA
MAEERNRFPPMAFTFAAAVRCVLVLSLVYSPFTAHRAPLTGQALSRTETRLREQVVLPRDQQIAFLETQTARAAILMARLAGIRR